MSSDAVRGVQRQIDGHHACSVANVDATKAKIVTLEELHKGLEEAIAQLEAEHSRQQWLNKALLVVSFTKASCEAFLGLAEVGASLVLGKTAGTAAKAVKEGYEILAPSAEILSTALLAGQIPKLSSFTALARGAAGKYGSDGTKILVSTKTIQIDLLTNAFAQDHKAMLGDAAKYGFELSKITAKYGIGDKSETIVSGVQTVVEYHMSLTQIIDQHFELEDTSREVFDNARLNFRMTALRLKKRIAELQKFVDSCPAVVEVRLM